MYIILWDDGENEYYDIRLDMLHRVYFIEKVCGYRYGRDYTICKAIDCITIHYDTIPNMHEVC